MNGKSKDFDHYARFVGWSEEDHAWIGYCPDLFPYGGVCHGSTTQEAFARLEELIEEEIFQLVKSGGALPEPKQLVSS